MARKRRNSDAEDAAHLNGPMNEDVRDRMEENGITVIDIEDEWAAPPVNSAARAEIIREAHQTISDLEGKIAGLKAEIKAVVETRIVAGLGMKKGDFALARKLVDLDQGERDNLKDTLRETFAALGVGMQLNWLDAYTQTGSDPDDAELGTD